jgi:hypothetical protein
MIERSEPSANSQSQQRHFERRHKPRIKGPIPARVRGVDISGKPFDIAASLDNLGAGGLHMRLERSVHRAARLFFVIHLPAHPGADGTGMLVAARGVARRIDPGTNDSCDIGVEFRRYRPL